MPTRHRRITAAGLVLAVLLATGAVAAAAPESPEEPALEQAVGALLDGLEPGAETRLEHLLGPLAPLAIQPFFALAVLTGMAWLAQEGYLPSNPYLSGHRLLANRWLFGLFLFLTLVTTVPALTKWTHRLIGSWLTWLEDRAGLVCVAILAVYGVVEVQQAPQAVSAGLGGESLGAALAAGFSVLNYFVIMKVRFAVDLLVLLSPIPLLDAFLELGKKFVVAALLTLYAFSPLAATLFNLFILMVALLFFRLAVRWTTGFKHLLLDPLLHRWRTLGVGAPAALVSPRTPGWLAARLTDAELSVPVVCRSYLPELAARPMSLAWLTRDQAGIRLSRRPWLRRPRSMPLARGDGSIRLRREMLGCRVEVLDARGRETASLTLSRLYSPRRPELLDLLEAESADTEEAGRPSGQQADGVRAAPLQSGTGG